MPKMLGTARRFLAMHPRQRRFEDSRGRTIPAKKRAAHLSKPLDADLAGVFILAAKARGWFGKLERQNRAPRDCRERLARGEITYLEACAAAPHASEDTKRKWRKVARA